MATKGVINLMLESHLHGGNQTLGRDPSMLKYGVSITDAFINWEQTDGPNPTFPI